MTKRLLTLFNTYFFALLLLPLVVAFIPVQSSGQSAGDVAFIGFNGDGNDDFAIVALEDIPANTEIFFTDQDWTGSNFSGIGDTFSWDSGSSTISAGTIIIFNDISTAGRTVNVGSYSGGSAITLKVSSTVIFAYLGSEDTPSTFLAAIATNSDQYDDTDGTLTNTSLIQGSTAILLSTNVDGAAYVGDRSGNTKNGYLSELNEIASNWDETGATGDGTTFLPFDDTSFTLISPPTVTFTASSLSVDEDGSSVDLTVELVESAGTAVDVDVAFLGSSSTAVTGDIGNYTTQTVNFTSGDGDETPKTVTITVTDDTEFEGTEKAVFQLQNNTAGSIISPDVLTLTINDNDAPDVVINEILYDPAGDADGNGSTDSSDDEFIEFVNNENSDIDISGWTVYDDAALDLRHTFPSGTVIPANGALVLFADDTVNPVGGFGGAIVQSSNESATLSLNNGGDTITLQDADGNTVVDETYSGSQSDKSITRDPDITGSFTGHSGATGSSSDFSPGTQIDGTAFGGGYAIGIRGNEGWRMISSPTQSTTFNDLFSDLWTQGITGSDDDTGAGTQFSWDETTGTFTAPVSMSENMIPGKGYIVYVFEDDEFSTPGVQGGFPKVVNTNETENTSPVTIGVTTTDLNSNSSIDTGDNIEGWNLLGNPFGTDLSVTALVDALQAADASAQASIHVYDHEAGGGAGDYVSLSGGDQLAPFQAFYIAYTALNVDADVSLNRSTLAANTGTEFFKQANNTEFEFNVSLHDEKFFDSFHVEFSDQGTLKLDKYDVYNLYSLNPNAINLSGLLGNQKLLKNNLPSRPEEIIEIPLAFDAPNRNKLTFRWDGIRELPQHWDITLIDRTLGRELDLRREKEYTFTFQQSTQNKAFGEEQTLYKKTPAKNGDVRFVLKVNPGQIVNNGNTNLPSSNQLNPNYPNPFNPTTTISYSLTQETQVKISVWNIVGQKVATLVDGVVEAGTHTELWNAGDMPSGIYIAQMEVGGNVYIRKMTLIK